MFTRADKDGDGKLTKGEWLSVLNSSGVPTSREEVEEFFQSMDRDFDGRLTFEEFMGEESTIEKLFKNMDKNGDGVVTKEVGYWSKMLIF
jgi:Ca2+-binding EF-hand superfamily protein